MQVSQKDWQYHSAKITCVAWSPDSSRLATGSIDTNVIVWSVATPDSVRDDDGGSGDGDGNGDGEGNDDD